ncbi:MAG TPA: class F sortase [Dehalococcoidia bacterium]|nr:class F sortase [Dehalococcoidia bacterium]
MYRWRYIILAALALDFVLLGFLTVALVARDRPEVATSEAYRELGESRDIRAEVRGEPTVPPVAEPPSASGTTPTSTPTPEPANFVAPVEKIRIPSIDVDASLIKMGVNAQGAMEVPNDPELVAWYDFTSKPGFGGNAVFSGHVDWVNYGPAVFWDLRELTSGDEVEIVLLDGTVLTYSVTASVVYPVEELNMQEILAPTAKESVTLITCAGQFTAGHYTDRRVVRAVLVNVVQP